LFQRLDEPAVTRVFRTESGLAELHEGDCMRWLREQPAHSFHAVVTDPPYGMLEYTPDQMSKMRAGRGGVWRIPSAIGGHKRAPVPRFTVLRSFEVEALYEFFREWGESLAPALVPGAHIFVAANPLLSHVTAQALHDCGYEKRGEIVRLTQTLRGGDRPKNAEVEFPDVTVMPRSAWEPWLLFRKPCDGTVAQNLRKWKTGGLRRLDESPFRDVIVSRPTRGDERALAPHPSLKPQGFLRQIVRAALPLGEGIVLDPFAGSGSTLAACEAIGYRSVGVELDPSYVTMATTAIPLLSRLQLPGSPSASASAAARTSSRGTRRSARASKRPTV
jgi:DNA modification methylase